LHTGHFRSSAFCIVVEAMKMKKTMRDVEAQLIIKRRAQASGLFSRGFGTDKNLTVLKGNYVGGPASPQETVMQSRYPPIRNQDHADINHPLQSVRVLPGELATRLENTPRESLEGHEIDADGPLPIKQG
jgi:hypothetical protein